MPKRHDLNSTALLMHMTTQFWEWFLFCWQDKKALQSLLQNIVTQNIPPPKLDISLHPDWDLEQALKHSIWAITWYQLLSETLENKMIYIFSSPWERQSITLHLSPYVLAIAKQAPWNSRSGPTIPLCFHLPVWLTAALWHTQQVPHYQQHVDIYILLQTDLYFTTHSVAGTGFEGFLSLNWNRSVTFQMFHKNPNGNLTSVFQMYFNSYFFA